MSVKSFVRFVDEQGRTVYGEPSASDLNNKLEGKLVMILTGDPFKGFSKTSNQATVKKVCLVFMILLFFLTESSFCLQLKQHQYLCVLA